MTSKDTEIVMIPYACYESTQHRFKQIIATIAVGWGASVLALGGAVAFILLR